MAIEQAGNIIRPLFRSALVTEEKKDLSPVTLADQGAEQAIRRCLTHYFPHYGLIGEEQGTLATESRFYWVVDPLDGTRAFITGRPTFGTLIALLDHGTPILGIINQPMTNERWIGIKGQPTRFSSPFGGQAKTRACSKIDEAELSCTSPEMLELAPTPFWPKLAKRVKRVSWGGDCYGYGLLSLGLIDLVAECDMKIWDWAALVPIIEGAGGYITDWAGQPLSHNSNGTVLAAGAKNLHEEAVSILSHSG
ncbi:inositol monophosphatase family protein [Entomobacter blattae]